LSGLIAMLTAMTILSLNNVSSNYERQLAFLAVAGKMHPGLFVSHVPHTQ
jgi:hypothetical protein